ncbi:hypothetical protein C8Q69DRAFT_462389 [Paecilomyces variotii]|uniref:Zn(2)-C6 fungal-type domain-containing protein n=1 Tax=Byssochlamys spectabilis TaxID=264951 RepID=A0A443HZ43_BYSSP|nr:hypothetical protein C8Q69DRAFT_462389 [Paecilomyces variotii]RWQ97118.1 hypothetical protein C8Q69DRAFT_462389 [Paecilomyces variotii]
MTYLGAESSKEKETSQIEKDRKRHCWECLRRRLVCDSTRPVCNRCSIRGLVCLGYDNVKPLTFLAPGRVTSRNRRAKGTASHKLENDHHELTTRTRPTLSPRTEDVIISHIEMRSEACDIIQAVQYCK